MSSKATTWFTSRHLGPRNKEDEIIVTKQSALHQHSGHVPCTHACTKKPSRAPSRPRFRSRPSLSLPAACKPPSICDQGGPFPKNRLPRSV